MTLVHIYVRWANFTTKPRFEDEKLPSFANSQGRNSWKEYSLPKSANAKKFAHKRGLVVKFAHLT